jgi:hypothetical protein
LRKENIMTLQELQEAVRELFPSSIYGVNWTASVDAAGDATIALWNNAIGTEPSTATLESALSASQLTAAKLAQNAVLLRAYENARYGTPVSITTVAGKALSFPSDTATQTNVMGYLAVFAGMSAKPASVPLLDANSALQSIAPADVQAIAEAILQASQTAFVKLAGLQSQVSAATTIANVQAVVWS